MPKGSSTSKDRGGGVSEKDRDSGSTGGNDRTDRPDFSGTPSRGSTTSQRQGLSEDPSTGRGVEGASDISALERFEGLSGTKQDQVVSGIFDAKLGTSMALDMAAAGMDPSSILDRSIAKGFSHFGMTPNPSKSFQNVNAANIAGFAIDTLIGGMVPGYGFATKVAGLMDFQTPGQMVGAEIAEAITSQVDVAQQTVTEAFDFDFSGPSNQTDNGGNEKLQTPATVSNPVQRILETAAVAEEELTTPEFSTELEPVDIFPDFELLNTDPFDILGQTKKTVT